MIKTCLFLFLTTATFQSFAQDLSLLLDKQVQAFNAKDIDEMMAQLHDDFKWYWITTDELVLEVAGKEAFQASMTSYYQSIPQVQSEIVERSVLGNRVSFVETVSYTNNKGNKGESSAMGMYEFKDGLIYRVWYYE